MHRPAPRCLSPTGIEKDADADWELASHQLERITFPISAESQSGPQPGGGRASHPRIPGKESSRVHPRPSAQPIQTIPNEWIESERIVWRNGPESSETVLSGGFNQEASPRNPISLKNPVGIGRCCVSPSVSEWSHLLAAISGSTVKLENRVRTQFEEPRDWDGNDAMAHRSAPKYFDPMAGR